MKKLINEWLVPSLLIGVVAMISGQTVIQEQDDEEIEIVNQDGVRINLQQLNWQDKDQNEEVNIEVGDGKIVIIDENGERREIDVSGAQNIIVNKSVRSIIRDGEEERKISGKAIIIGPDGEKQEIQLGEGLEDLGELGGVIGRLEVMPFFKGEGEEGRLPGQFFFHRVRGGKYMIGVSCQPVNDQLRIHLDIPEGVGLVVTGEPSDEGPAAEAGIENHDILMYADQNELNSVQDLVDAVQQAGEEDRELSLTLIRRGNEIGIEVKPVERKGIGQGFDKRWFFPDGEANFQFEKFGPGVIFDAEKGNPEGLLERFEEMDEKIKARMKELAKLKEELREWRQKERDDD